MSESRLPDESAEYRKLRHELLEAEIALKEQVTRVAALRRQLPADTTVADYELQEGPRNLAEDAPGAPVRLSELFEDPEKPLILIHFMYGGAQTNPCPMCSMWADGYNAVARHVRDRANFALVAEATVDEMRRWARERGWSELRLVSSLGSSLKQDLRMQDPDGSQHPGVSIFTRAADGTPRHFYTAEAVLAPGHWNGVDLLSPVWNLFDLTPDGRGDWFPKLRYSTAATAP